MNVVDLSHFIAESMPVYPGSEPPRIVDACTVAKNGFAEKLLSLYSHTGTHIDAPGHILAGAATLDKFAVGHFLGPGCVLNVSGVKGTRIEISDLEKEKERIAAAEFVLLHAGWAQYWGDPRYFSAYPVLTAAAAHWLAGFDLKGIGVDMISVDEMNSTAMAIHKVFFAKNMVIVENLANLEALLSREFMFFCLPLKIAGGDGSPVRAIAILDSSK
jgi:arylformamidase